MKPNVIIINERDNVAVALEDIEPGSMVMLPSVQEFPVFEKIPYSHKVAVMDISKDEAVVKYGECIGTAAVHIKKGSWVHTHNLATDGRAV